MPVNGDAEESSESSRISLSFMLSEWREDHKRLRGIELMLTELNAKFGTLPATLEDHEKRLREAETWRQNFIGKWAMIVVMGSGIVAAAIGQIIQKVIH